MVDLREIDGGATQHRGLHLIVVDARDRVDPGRCAEP
jgi:hypothetical protein